MWNTVHRQWTILRLLPKSPKAITAPELREKLRARGFEVTVRTIERDLTELAGAGLGFPITNEAPLDERMPPQTKNRWAWEENAPLITLPAVDTETAMSFNLAKSFLPSLLSPSAVSHLNPYFQQAEEVLDQIQKSGMPHWSEKVRIVPFGQRLLPAVIAPESLNVIYRALFEAKRMTLRYHALQREDAQDFEVHPLGLVFREYQSYLVCTIWEYQDIRQLALSRMEQVTLTEQASRTPDGFSLADYIEREEFGYLVSSKPVRLKMFVSEIIATYLRETPVSEDQQLIQQREGQIRLEATVPHTWQLLWWILSLGLEVKVLHPQKLREELARQSKGMYQKYRSPQRK